MALLSLLGAPSLFSRTHLSKQDEGKQRNKIVKTQNYSSKLSGDFRISTGVNQYEQKREQAVGETFDPPRWQLGCFALLRQVSARGVCIVRLAQNKKMQIPRKSNPYFSHTTSAVLFTLYWYTFPVPALSTTSTNTHTHTVRTAHKHHTY